MKVCWLVKLTNSLLFSSSSQFYFSSTITASTCMKSSGQNSGGREALQSRGIGLLIRAGNRPKTAGRLGIFSQLLSSSSIITANKI